MLVGLVGRPSSGKSTFFKAATLMDVLIADYPFATIKPNHGVGFVKVPDLAQEFDKVCEPREGYVRVAKHPERPETQGQKDGSPGVKDKQWRFVGFDLMDVAGLVAGASEGKGLGNEFLSDLAGADAFIQMVDVSGESDSEGKPAKDYDPLLDVQMIESELDAWYYGILQKVWKGFARKVEMEKGDFAEAVGGQFSGLKVNADDVKDAVRKSGLDSETPGKWSDDEVRAFAQALRVVSKPMVIAANKVDTEKGKENLEKLKKEVGYPVIACFSEGELALREADKAGLVEYVPGEKDFEITGDVSDKQREALDGVEKVMKGFGGTGVQEVLDTVVKEVLGMLAVYPAGDKLVDSDGKVLPDCYLMREGSTALDFAGRIHGDLAKGFIKAIDVRTKQARGKEYVLKDGDGLEIVTR
jgi:ribosome-binding ATPase YchF (GTP1/OBG family)